MEGLDVMEFEKLQQIIAEVFSVESSKVQQESSFVKDFGADSMHMFEVLMGVESVFGIVIPEEATASWGTVAELWEFLQKRL